MQNIKLSYDSFGFPDFSLFTPGKEYYVNLSKLFPDAPGITISNLDSQTIFKFAAKEISDRFGNENIKLLHPVGNPILLKIHSKWEGPYDWHYFQDGITLIPVLSAIHKKFVHTGGLGVVFNNLIGFFESPQS